MMQTLFQLVTGVEPGAIFLKKPLQVAEKTHRLRSVATMGFGL